MALSKGSEERVASGNRLERRPAGETSGATRTSIRRGGVSLADTHHIGHKGRTR